MKNYFETVYITDYKKMERVFNFGDDVGKVFPTDHSAATVRVIFRDYKIENCLCDCKMLRKLFNLV